MTTSLGSFTIGQQPVITATFEDVTGGTGIVTAVTFMVRTPAGVETSVSSPNAAISNPSPNVWKYTMPTLTAADVYHVRCKSTAGLTAATETSLVVLPSAFATP